MTTEEKLRRERVRNRELKRELQKALTGLDAERTEHRKTQGELEVARHENEHLWELVNRDLMRARAEHDKVAMEVRDLEEGRPRISEGEVA